MSGPTTSRSLFSRVRARVRRLPGGWVLWRVGITIVGVAIVAIGVVLLPLPGPGWVIIFAGLGVLATEYSWAAALLERVRRFFERWKRWVESRPVWARGLMGVLGVLIVAAVVFAVWWYEFR